MVAIGVGVLAAVAGASPPASAAMASSAALYAFGYNGFGQLGNALDDESEAGNPVPAPVTLPAGASGSVTQVAAGQLHSLALTSTGQLYAFGSNFTGQLGSDRNSATEESNPTPALVTLPGAGGPVTQIAAGSEHSLALTSTGQLYAFGDNVDGQLASETNSGTEQANPTPALVVLPGASGPVTEIAAGGNHSLVLTSTDQLFAFGSNRYGQLGTTTGNGSDAANPTPALVVLPGASGAVTQIAAGSEHSLALTAAGQLYAFGWNGRGQLGSETNSGTGAANPTPALVVLPGASGPVTQIAAGGNHSLALTSTGQLFAFGSNTYGQLGNETNSGTEQANPTPTAVTLPGAVGQVTQIAAGRQDSLAVTSSGQLYAFGENGYGQLGSEINFGASGANSTPALVALPRGTTVDAVARGADALHTLVLATTVTSTVAGTVAGQAAISPSVTGIEPPTLTAVSLTHKRFRVADRATAISARSTSLGTSFHFTLSAPARLQIAITRTAEGLRRGHSCLAPTPGLERMHAKRCTRTLTVGTLTRETQPKGADGVAFSGRIGRRALSPRAYDAVLSASDAAGHSRQVRVAFVVVR